MNIEIKKAKEDKTYRLVSSDGKYQSPILNLEELATQVYKLLGYYQSQPNRADKWIPDID